MFSNFKIWLNSRFHISSLFINIACDWHTLLVRFNETQPSSARWSTGGTRQVTLWHFLCKHKTVTWVIIFMVIIKAWVGIHLSFQTQPYTVHFPHNVCHSFTYGTWLNKFHSWEQKQNVFNLTKKKKFIIFENFQYNVKQIHTVKQSGWSKACIGTASQL